MTLKRRFAPYLIKCIVFVMLFSMVSPALPSAFAEDIGSSEAGSVSTDTYGATSSEAVSGNTYAPIGTPIHVPSQDSMSLFNYSTATTATYSTYADGQYTIGYKVVRTTDTSREVTAFRESYGNADRPGRVIVKNGQYTFSFRGINAESFTEVTATQNNQTSTAVYTQETQAATNHSTAKNYTRVHFDVYDLNGPITLNYKFNDVAGSGYLILDTSTLTKDNTGETPSTPADPELVEPATGTRQTLNYTVLKDGTSETSMMDSYMQKPATLVTTADNKRYIQLGINSSSMVTELQTDVNGSYTNAGIIAKDTTNDIRTVQFPADALTTSNSQISGKVHVTIPALQYDNWYTVQFQFDNSSLIEETVSDINYTVLKNGTEETSIMDGYMNKPAQLVTKGNQHYIRLTINSSSLITSLQTRQNGTYTEVDTLSEDHSKNMRVIQFPIDDVSQKVDAYTHVVISGIGYDNWYYVQFKFGNSVQTPIYQNGDYNLNYTVLHATKEQPSSMANYFTAPATFTAKDGKYYVSFTVKSSSIVTSLKTEAQGTLVESTIVSQDAANNTRQIRFEVANLDDILKAQVHVKATPTYEADYAIRLKFDASSLSPVTTAPSTGTIADGQYDVNFTVYKNGTNETSVMDGYTAKPAQLIADAGKYTIRLTLKNSSWIPSFQTKVEGKLQEALTVSTGNDTRVVEFAIDNPTQKVEAYTHVVIPALNYNNWYTVQLQLDTSGLLPDTTTPEVPTPENPVPEVPTPQQPTTPDGMADGTYSASLTAYKYGTKETSVMDGYLGKPATVIKKGGKYVVQVLLKNSSWIKTFKVGGQEAEVIATSGDTRTVQFPVTDLPRKVKVNTHVIVPDLVIGGMDYDHTYDVDLQVGSLTLYEAPILSTTTTAVPLDFAKLAAGTYKLPFSIVMPGIASGTSTPLERFMPDDQPVQLTVENDSRYVTLTLNNGNEIKTLRVGSSDGYKDAEVISSDEAKNTKTVKFSVSDYTKNVPAQLVTTGGVSIASTSADSSSDTVYDFEFKFDTSAVTADSKATDASSDKGNNNIADGDYTATYRILKNGTDTDSVLTPYLDRTAQLTAKNGKVYATIQVTDSESVPMFMTDYAGKYTAPQIVAQSQDGKSRTITFEVPNLDSKLSIFAQALNTGKMGGQLLFDRSTLRSTTDSAQAVPAVETVPSSPSGASEATPAGEAAVDSNVSANTGNTEPSASEAAAQKYSIAVKVYKDKSNELSVMNDYIKPTATLIEEKGQTYAELTLNNGSWMPVLQVEQDGVLKDVEKISSTDKVTTVRFKVDNLSGKINAYTHVVVPGLIIGGVPYDHWYNVQLKFDEATKKAKS